jgi:Holliday junction resolvase RusA-like endonuclease
VITRYEDVGDEGMLSMPDGDWVRWVDVEDYVAPVGGWSVTIPGNPPTLNSTYKVVTIAGHSRLAKHSAVATWQDTVAWLTRAAVPKDWSASRRVRVEITWWTARTHDADAGLKALLDGLAVGLGINDRCFLPTVVSNEVDAANPRTEVMIRNES